MKKIIILFKIAGGLIFLIFVLSGGLQKCSQKASNKLLEEIAPDINPDRKVKEKVKEPTDPEEQYQLALAYRKKGLYHYAKEVTYLYTKAAEQGHLSAQAELGKYYYKDIISTRGNKKPDLPQAVHWYTKAAAQGHTLSMMSLGEIYKNGGTGLLKDPEQSKHFYTKGISSYKARAETADVNAQYTSGSIYKDGKATKKDLSEAAMWFEKAALNGHSKAQFEMGRAYSSGLRVEKDFVRGLAWYEVARFYGMKLTSGARHKEEVIAKAVSISKGLIQQIEENKKSL